MDDKIVLVYERIDSARYQYELIGVIVPKQLWSVELPASPSVDCESIYLDPIFNKEDEKFLKELKQNAEYIPLDC